MDRFDKSRKELGANFVDDALAKFGMGPKYKPKPKQIRICPQCGSENTTIEEVHPDTSINEIVGICHDCNYEGETKEFKAKPIMSKEKSQIKVPSAGAMGAARDIVSDLYFPHDDVVPLNSEYHSKHPGNQELMKKKVDYIAAIIKEKTHEAELLEVVKAMDDYWSEDYDGPDDKNAKEQFHSRTIDIWNSMRAAIAKAEKR